MKRFAALYTTLGRDHFRTHDKLGSAHELFLRKPSPKMPRAASYFLAGVGKPRQSVPTRAF